MLTEDRISNLPSEILVVILSFSTIRDAARTSILSRRWRDLWKFADNLNFDQVNRLGRYRDDFGPYYARLENFSKWVDNVMALHQRPSLDQLTVHHYLDSQFSHYIDRWISFAIAKKVTRLSLDFSRSIAADHGEYYRFPYFNVKQEVTSIRYMSLTECHLELTTLHSFKSLRSLSLTNGDVTDEVIQSFLSNCLTVENLKVCYARGLVHPRVVGSSLRLKCLEIFFCKSLKSVEIDARDLKCLKYIGPKICFSLKNTPHLTDVTLIINSRTCNDCLNYALGQLKGNIFRLEAMELNLFPNEVVAIPLLSKLRVLVLQVTRIDMNLLAFTSLLKMAPSLQRFELRLSLGWLPIPVETETKDFERPHMCLREVELGGFRGHKNEVDLLMFLLNNCTALDTIILEPHEKFADGRRERIPDKRELQIGREHAMQFRDKLCSNVNVVIL